MKILPILFSFHVLLLLVFSNLYSEALSVDSKNTSPLVISARWQKHSSSLSTPSPPRSGHVAFHLGSVPYIFGGYAEETASKRYVVNDLWKFISFEKGWEKVPYTNQNNNKLSPRLVAAAAKLEDKAFIFGGWDSQVAGTGGEILDDVFSFECSNNNNNNNDSIRLDNDNFPPFPTGPTSRHVAVSLNDNTVLIHDFRCNDYVWLFTMDEKWIKQPVTGTGPSSRGLHCASVLASTKSKHVLLFGGADKQGQMSCETFLLDTMNWEWTKVESPKKGPCGRAGASLVSLSDQSGAILFGGAKPNDGALQGLNDLWYFSMDTKTWTEIKVMDSIPPGRNAATLTLVTPPESHDTDDDTFLLCGGWQPFVKTHDDIWSLHITKST